jgi:acetylornithine deacetylase/succinyl-diaminopimelate desuccinylase-like protein
MALEYAKQNRTQFVETLKEFLRIPSISTDTIVKDDMLRAAEFVAAQLRSLGMVNVGIHPTALHPVVLGESPNYKDAPTVLVYGHYDVQPADPLELWTSEPFHPEQRGENLYARGSSDMKGQIIATLKAIESCLAAGDMPVNLKFIFEGEEEIGSPNLKKFIEDNKDRLTCDMVLNPDTSMIGPDTPTIIYALRGLGYFEIRLYGPDHDLHSGMFGGAVHNPAQVLCELVAGMHDEHGRVTLPGFYDKVAPLEAAERAELARLPMGDEYYAKQAGVKHLWSGEEGYSVIERVGARPTLDVNGLFSGFTGEGSKTVLPAYAMAKISTRLVAHQRPEYVLESLRQYLQAHVPDTIRWELIQHSGGLPSISSITSPGALAIRKALETVWGEAPLYKREGGSVPVVADMQDILGVDSVLTGFGLPDDNIHAPDEKLHLPTWYCGIDALVHFFYNAGEG